MTRFILGASGLLGIVFIADGVLGLADSAGQPPDAPAFIETALAFAGTVKVFFGSFLLTVAIGLDELIRLSRKSEGHLSRMAPPEPDKPGATSIWSLRAMTDEADH